MPELVFGVIRGGGGVDTLVFIPAERAKELVEIYFALDNASTWRQFSECIPSHDWNELLEVMRGDPPFELDDQFEKFWIPGVEDGDWPDWPEQRMMDWIPSEIWRRYGSVHDSVSNGPFLSLDPKLLPEIIEALQLADFRCHADDLLIKAACGRIELFARLMPATVH